MSGRGKGGKGLGKGGAKRHRKVLRDNIQGITKPAIRRLARRGGVKRISGLIYEETRGVLKIFLENVIRDAVTYTEHARRKTVTAMDVECKQKFKGGNYYGLIASLLCVDSVVIVPATTGQMGILPGHVPTIAELKPCLLSVHEEEYDAPPKRLKLVHGREFIPYLELTEEEDVPLAFWTEERFLGWNQKSGIEPNQQVERSDILDIDKKKYLVPADLTACQVVYDASNPKVLRTRVKRDHYGAHDRLVMAYFSENPQYDEATFRDRHRSISTLMKCTFAVRQLAYGCVSGSLDEYLQMGATTTRDFLRIFCKVIMNLYGEEFLHKPTYTDMEKLYAYHDEKHGFRGMLGSIDWKAPDVPFMANNVPYKMGYYLTDGIYPQCLEAAIESGQRLYPVNETVIDCCSSSSGNGIKGDVFGPRKMVECRICQDEDYDSNMESPCSCCGSLKKFKPGYTAPPSVFRLGGIPSNFRGHWQIARRDISDTPRMITVASSNHNFLAQEEYDEYSDSTVRSILCFRSVAAILLLVRTCGIIVPIYIILRAASAMMHRRHQLASNASTPSLSSSDEEAGPRPMQHQPHIGHVN
ncbi:ALP1-like protein [Tanacetum coccineum]